MKWLKHILWKYVTRDAQYEENQVSCNEIVLDVTHDLYEKLLTEASAAGAAFNGGQASISGMTFDWAYDAEVQKLHVTCTRKPFYFTCQLVENHIRDLVAKAGESL